MPEKLIGSLIYGNHPAAPNPGAWKKRAIAIGAISVVLLVAAGIAYRYANYREEARVQAFLDELHSGRYEDAFARWDSNGRYLMADFLQDWGSEGFYTKGATNAKVVSSRDRGSMVIVQVTIDKFKKPIGLRVDKETFKLSFAPNMR